MPDLSIVFGTFNRLRFLKRCLECARLAVGSLTHEIIIVDGGSSDGTLAYLRKQKDVTLIEHGELRGPVAAYNDGFHAATGEFVAYLNDDLFLEPRTLSAAVKVLKDNPKVGVISIPYRNPNTNWVSLPMATVGGRKIYPFASFGVLRREQGEQVGWFTDQFYHYYGDITLCLNIYKLGYIVQALPAEYTAAHQCADNAVRGINRWNDPNSSTKRDGIAFEAYWKGKL